MPKTQGREYSWEDRIATRRGDALIAQSYYYLKNAIKGKAKLPRG